MSPAGAMPQMAQNMAQASDGYGYPDYSSIEPAAGPEALPVEQPVAAAPRAGAATAYPALVDPVMAQRTAALQNEVARLEERLQRVEKATLRLDRRMQLVERNELSRMGGNAALDDAGQPQVAEAGADADIPVPVRAAVQNYAGYGEGFQPVSVPITSALQAAPAAGSGRLEEPRTVQVASNRLPSLADPAAGGSTMPGADDRLAVWTVHYEDSKVWPDRTQLPSSRDVVGLLREGSKVTLFARGPQPNSREFRERVKALSRYLAKVSSLDSVPIAAMSAPHLNEDTIEIFAAP